MDTVFKADIVNEETGEAARLSFPVTREVIAEVFMQIGLSPMSDRFDFSVTNYDFGGTGYNISFSPDPHVDIDELNYLSHRLAGLSNDEMDVFRTVVEALPDEYNSVESLINLTANTEYYEIVPDIYEYSDLAGFYLDQAEISLGEVYDYFDWERYGRDMEQQNGGYLHDGVYILPDNAKWEQIYDTTAPEKDIPQDFVVTARGMSVRHIAEEISDAEFEAASELAFDLDGYFRKCDKDYALTDPHSMRELYTEQLTGCKIEFIKERLEKYPNEALSRRLKEYEHDFNKKYVTLFRLSKDISYPCEVDKLRQNQHFINRGMYVFARSVPFIGTMTPKAAEYLLANFATPYQRDVISINDKGVEKAYFVEEGRLTEIPEFTGFQTRAAAISNYKDYTVLMGCDNKVYLGKSENYLFNKENGYIPFYRNDDNSLIYISDNEKMFSLLSCNDWTVSQEEMLANGAFKESDYAEFAALQGGILSTLDKIREIKFAGKPFAYIESAETNINKNNFEEEVAEADFIAMNIDNFLRDNDPIYSSLYPDIDECQEYLSACILDKATVFLKDTLAEYDTAESNALLNDINTFEKMFPDAVYKIYQVKDIPETRDYRYAPLNELKSRGLEVNRENYELKYTHIFMDDTTLESIYEKFNRPVRDFKGHSMSVSDVVVIEKDGKETAYYCDMAGFKEIPGVFTEHKREIKPSIRDNLKSLQKEQSGKGQPMQKPPEPEI